MPAEHYIDDEAHLIITTWEGEAADAEFIEVFNNYLDEIQSNPDYIDYNEVFDLSNVTKFKLSIDGLLTLGRMASVNDHIAPNRKLALIVGTTLVFSIANFYVSYRNLGKRFSKDIHVFTQEVKAYEWVNSKSKGDSE